jgi:hypothetical protein
VQQWQKVFWISTAMLVSTGVLFVAFAKSELQPWNTPDALTNGSELISMKKKQRQRRRQERHTHKTIKTTPCPNTIGQNTVQSPVLIEINSIVRMPTPPRLVIGPCFCLVPRPLSKQVGFDG